MTEKQEHWIYRDGMVLQAGKWTDSAGKKHHDFKFPIVIAHVSDSWDQHQWGRMLAAGPALADAVEALLKVARQFFANTEAGEKAFRDEYATAIAALASLQTGEGE